MISFINLDPDSPSLILFRQWVEAEWGEVDPFGGVYDQPGVPAPIVGVDEGELLGGVAFTNAPLPGNDEIGVWINALFVRPESRGQGLGSMLVARAEEAANAGELFVLTEVPTLYEKLGWRVIERTENGSVLTKQI